MKKIIDAGIIGFLGILLLLNFTGCEKDSHTFQVSTFSVDVSPPIGSPVAYAPARSITDPISAKGVVILSDQSPVVLCVVDYLGVANKGQQLWKEALATAANTTTDRVSVHALHQHDGPRCDYDVERILSEHGLGGTRYDTAYLNKTIRNVAKAVSESLETAQTVTHLGFGEAKVDKVASNRRILGEDGKVAIIRWSKTTDSAAIAAPEGLIDPWLKSVSFWDNDKPVAVMTYYATHPQSYYGEGDVTCEFVGIARNTRETTLGGLPHIHFNGASGNITAGKYNDGSKENRPVLARKLETAMKEAWDNTQKVPISASDLVWKTTPVQLPLGPHLIEKDLRAILENDTTTADQKFIAAKHLAWLQTIESGKKIDVSSLRMG